MDSPILPGPDTTVRTSPSTGTVVYLSFCIVVCAGCAAWLAGIFGASWPAAAALGSLVLAGLAGLAFWTKFGQDPVIDKMRPRAFSRPG